MRNPSFKKANATSSFKVLAAATAIGMIVLAGSAQAKSLGHPCTTVPENQWLSMQELQTKVEALGYNIQKTKLEKGCAEFYTHDKTGGKIELFVDPSSGQVVGQLSGKK